MLKLQNVPAPMCHSRVFFQDEEHLVKGTTTRIPPHDHTAGGNAWCSTYKDHEYGELGVPLLLITAQRRCHALVLAPWCLFKLTAILIPLPLFY